MHGQTAGTSVLAASPRTPKLSGCLCHPLSHNVLSHPRCFPLLWLTWGSVAGYLSSTLPASLPSPHGCCQSPCGRVSDRLEGNAGETQTTAAWGHRGQVSRARAFFPRV